MKTIQSAWEDFLNDVVPKDAPEVQKIEMKNSFYAGAAILFELMKEVADKFDDESGSKILDGIYEEIEIHFAELEKSHTPGGH